MTEHEPTPFARPARALIPLLAVGLLLLSGQAQAIMFGTEQPTKLHDNVDGLIASSADCNADERFTYSLVDVMSGQSLQVWGSLGADCSLQTEREGASATCVQLGSTQSITNTTASVTVTVKDLATTVSAIDGCTDSSAGNTIHDVSVYFLIDPSGDVSEFVSDVIKLDFIGPGPPTLNSVGPAAADALTVSWSPPEGESNIDYSIYCATATAGSEAGGTSDDMTCAAADLTPGELPTGNTCSDVISGTNGQATGLQEGTLYAIGVAGADNIDNPGFLSNLRCATPEPVVGFYDTIGDVDGLCTISTAPSTQTRWGWILVGLTVLGSTVARRRRAR